MRPIHRQALTQAAPKKLVNRDAQRLRFDIQTSIFNRSDCLRDHASRGRPGQRVEHCADPRNCTWIRTDQACSKLANNSRETRNSAALAELRPTDQTVV